MMTFQVSRELPPSTSNPAILNHLTQCAPVQHRPSDCSAPLHHQCPSSISGSWGSMNNTPSNRCVLLLYCRLCLKQTQQQLQLGTTTPTPVPPRGMLPRYRGTSPVQPSPVTIVVVTVFLAVITMYHYYHMPLF